MPRYFAHTYGRDEYCVLDENNHVVEECGTDLEYGQAHRIARRMNEEASEIQEVPETTAAL